MCQTTGAGLMKSRSSAWLIACRTRTSSMRLRRDWLVSTHISGAEILPALGLDDQVRLRLEPRHVERLDVVLVRHHDLPALQRERPALAVGNDAEDDLVEVGLAGLPVLVELRQADEVAALLFGELERARCPPATWLCGLLRKSVPSKMCFGTIAVVVTSKISRNGWNGASSVKADRERVDRPWRP